MTMVETHHGYDSGSLSYEQLQLLCDTIAAECLRQSEAIDEMQTQINDQRMNLEKWSKLTETLRGQVEAGRLSAEAAVGMLQGRVA